MPNSDTHLFPFSRTHELSSVRKSYREDCVPKYSEPLRASNRRMRKHVPAKSPYRQCAPAHQCSTATIMQKCLRVCSARIYMLRRRLAMYTRACVCTRDQTIQNVVRRGTHTTRVTNTCVGVLLHCVLSYGFFT